MIQYGHRQAAAATLGGEHFQVVFVAVVGDDERLCNEQLEKQRQRLRGRRRSQEIVVGDTVNARRLSGNVDTRIDAAAVRCDVVAIEDDDGPLDDAGLLRRLGCGFEVEGSEVVGKSGSDGLAARCGSDDLEGHW